MEEATSQGSCTVYVMPQGSVCRFITFKNALR